MALKLSLKSWSNVNWSQVEQTVKSYRFEIFLAARSGDLTRVRYLQRRVYASTSALLWAVRRVTLENKGKRTPGIDKEIFINNVRRWELFLRVYRKGVMSFKPLPARRVYILKANGKLRPLGIPVILDRVIQSLSTIALEPEWEAYFEHCSYGFRPARSCHDAMIRVYKTLNKKNKIFVLEGDIKGCFDNISHEALLSRLVGFPGYDLIAGWLKAGYMEEGKFLSTVVGTPQGGAISPLLANIALHGMEKALGITYHKNGYVRSECPYTLIRYADDFLVLTTSYESAVRAKSILTSYLLDMGLSLSEEKTSITDARAGFDFLGWTFKLYPDNRKPSGLVTLVTPSRKSVVKVKEKMKSIWRLFVGNPVGSKIRNLNSVIIGWANYHRFVDSNRIFRSLDHFNFSQAVRFARRQHAEKSWTWIVSRYFKAVGRDNWVFFDKTHGSTLSKFRSYKILPFIPVKYGMYPDDPACAAYFASRKEDTLLRRFSSNKGMLKMLEAQGTLCPICGQSLGPEDNDMQPLLHVHHLVPRSVGGLNVYNNLMLLHSSCHRTAHSGKYSRDVLITRLADFISKASLSPSVKAKVKWGSLRNPSFRSTSLLPVSLEDKSKDVENQGKEKEKEKKEKSKGGVLLRTGRSKKSDIIDTSITSI